MKWMVGILLFCALSAFGQGNYDANWCFGFHAGLHFEDTTITRFFTNHNGNFGNVIQVSPCCTAPANAYVVNNISVTQAYSNYCNAFNNGGNVYNNGLPFVQCYSGSSIFAPLLQIQHHSTFGANVPDIYINGTLTVDHDLEISNTQIYMGPNAKILLTNGAYLTIDNQSVLKACNSMWDGIYIDGITSQSPGFSPAKLVINESKIYDALNAVVSSRNGDITISHQTQFINNYKSVVIKNMPYNNGRPYKALINNATFTCDGSSLKAPYSSRNTSLTHIEVDNVQCYVPIGIIGNTRGFHNNFLNADTGIAAHNALLQVINNMFGNAVGKLNNPTISVPANIFVGVYVDNTDQPYPEQIGYPGNRNTSLAANLSGSSQTVYYANYFNQCTQAVYLKNVATYAIDTNWVNLKVTSGNGANYIGLKVDNSIFKFAGSGPHYSYIRNNNINLFSTSNYGRAAGMQLDEQEKQLNVYNNEITFPSNIYSYSYGIVANCYPINPQGYLTQVYNNNVANAAYGIGISHFNAAFVYNNNVSLYNNLSTPLRYHGISLFSNKVAIASCNNVLGNTATGSTNSNSQRAFNYVVPNVYTVTNCNYTSNVGSCFDIRTAANGFTISNNNMTNFVNGIVLGAGTPNSVIGSQGTTTTTLDNSFAYFSGYPFYYYPSQSIALLSPFYLRGPVGASVYYPNYTFNSVLGYQSNGILYSVTSPSNSIYNCAYGCGNIKSSSLDAISIDMTWAHAVATGTLVSGLRDSAIWMAWHKYNLYYSLLGQDSLIATDSALASFMASYAQSAFPTLDGLMADVNSLGLKPYNASAYTSLQAQINAVPANDNLETTAKSYVSLYASASLQGNSNEIWQAMKTLGDQCPWYGGPACGWARGYVQRDSIDYVAYLWADTCATGGAGAGFRRAAPQHNDTIDNQPPVMSLTYKLIPNLFKNNFSAYITLGFDETGLVQLYDLDGRMMGEYKLVQGRNDIDLSVDALQTGVYLYKVYVNGAIKTNDRIVVVH